MALISRFICSSEISFSSYSTSALLPGRLTDADCMPGRELSFRSTWAEQAAHAIPTTGIVFLIILCCYS